MVPIGREFSLSTPELRDFTYTMRRYDDPLPEEAGSYDIVGMTCHGFAVTHVDALCHVFTPEGKHGMYNGFSIDNVTDVGATKLASSTLPRPASSDAAYCSMWPKSGADRFRWAPRSCRRIWTLQRHSTA